MNPYAEKVPLYVRVPSCVWWTLAFWVALAAALSLLPPAIEVVDRLKGFVAVLGGRAP